MDSKKIRTGDKVKQVKAGFGFQKQIGRVGTVVEDGDRTYARVIFEDGMNQLIQRKALEVVSR